MRYAYADHNFLSTCAERHQWIKVLRDARQRGITALVLSPIHFYEFGNARSDIREQILDLVEELDPVWTFSQADLQMLELAKLWATFWGANVPPFSPLCTLNEAVAIMHRVMPDHVKGTTLRDLVTLFVGTGREELWASLHAQEHASAANQKLHQRGDLTRGRIDRIDCLHIAIQLARLERDFDTEDTYRRAHDLLNHEPFATQIETFVYWRLHTQLRCYEVESLLTSQIWASTAKLSRNRAIDRQHAVVALPFCDDFITDDVDLMRRCEFVRTSTHSKIARVTNATEFLATLTS